MTRHDRQIPHALMAQKPLAEVDRQQCQALLVKNDFTAFKSLARDLLKSHDDPFLWSMLGKVALKELQVSEAINAFQNVVRLTPDDAEAHADLAFLFLDQAELQLAEEEARLAVKLNPRNAVTLTALGRVLATLGFEAKAAAKFEKALRLDPDLSMAHAYLGDVYLALGRSEDAEACYRKTVELTPANAEAHRLFSKHHRYTPDDPMFAQLAELHQSLEGYSGQIDTGFALSKAFEDIGEYEVAFQLIREANALDKKTRGYDFSLDKELFVQIARTAPRLGCEDLTLRDDTQSIDDIIPIFVIGMPRSGTSLISQIISSHREVSNAGELVYAEKFGMKLAVGLEAITSDRLSDFRLAYLEAVSPYEHGRTYLVDKMPQNFLFVPLLAAAFPEAHFVHAKRDPAATCWSNFQRLFKGKALSYSCDMDDTRNYFALYAALMENWKALLPGRITDVSYEALTEDPDAEIPQLITALGLDWDPACLAPEKNKAAMRTASAEQVRKPIYKGSSKAWERYAPMIAGRFDGLDELPR